MFTVNLQLKNDNNFSPGLHFVDSDDPYLQKVLVIGYCVFLWLNCMSLLQAKEKVSFSLLPSNLNQDYYLYWKEHVDVEN